jgi:hypothetical protein
VRAVTDPCASCDRVNACALVAAPPRQCSAATTGSRRRSKIIRPEGPLFFAAGQLCHATGARLVPWRQPGGWGIKSLIASTAPSRPEPDAGVVRRRPKRAHESRARHRAMRRPSSSKSSVSLTAVRSARGEGGRQPANGARWSAGVLVLAARRAPWRPHTSRGSRRMGATDSERCPRAMLALLPARRPTMTTCCVCEPVGAPSLVARPSARLPRRLQRGRRLQALCAKTGQHCWTLANDLIFGARRRSRQRLNDGEDSSGRERDVEADQRDCLVHSRGEVRIRSQYPEAHGLSVPRARLVGSQRRRAHRLSSRAERPASQPAGPRVPSRASLSVPGAATRPPSVAGLRPALSQAPSTAPQRPHMYQPTICAQV